MIYFVRAAELNRVKIGFTGKVGMGSRLAALRTCSPCHLEVLALIEGEVEDELQLHRLFSHLRIHGEWFEYSPELRDYVAALHGAPVWTGADLVRSTSA